MKGIKSLKRVVLGILAFALLLGPLAVGVDAQSDEEPDMALLFATLDGFIEELAKVDFDGDGVVPDVIFDEDGLPIFVPEGFPGERDIQTDGPLYLARINEDLEAEGFDTVVDISDESLLLGDCSGFAMSFDEDGTLQDMAIGLGSRDGGGPTGTLVDLYGDGFSDRAFTKDNPFQVYERVVYFGTLPREGEGAIEHNWEIKTSQISLDKGGDPNPNGKNRNAGQVDIGDTIPSWARFTGIFGVEAYLDSENGLFCEAEGWVEFVGPFPLFTALGAAATVFFAGGILGLLFNSRPAYTWRA
jgi:hypothetical protein